MRILIRLSSLWIVNGSMEVEGNNMLNTYLRRARTNARVKTLRNLRIRVVVPGLEVNKKLYQVTNEAPRNTLL